MKKGTIGLIAGLAGLLILVGGFSVASNMGFKFVPNVPAGEYFNLSIPWNQNFTKGHEIFNDLVNQGGGLDRLSKYTAIGTFQDWFVGAGQSNNWDIVKGEAYILHTDPLGSGCTTAVVVGSHDPNYTFSFNAGEYFNAAAPYHQTLTTASALFNDLNTQLGGQISRISKYTSIGTFQDWFVGASASNQFSLDLGMGVIIYADSNVSGYVWPHY